MRVAKSCERYINGKRTNRKNCRRVSGWTRKGRGRWGLKRREPVGQRNWRKYEKRFIKFARRITYRSRYEHHHAGSVTEPAFGRLCARGEKKQATIKVSAYDNL